MEHYRLTESPPAKAGSRFSGPLGASPLRSPLMLRAKRLLTLRETQGSPALSASPSPPALHTSELGHDGGAMPGPISGTDRAWGGSSACALIATAAPRGRHDPDRNAGRPAPLLPTPPARRSVRRGRPPLGRMDLACGSNPPDTYFHNCAPSLDGPSLLASLQHTNALQSPAWCPKLTKTISLALSRSSTPGIGSREQPRDPWRTSKSQARNVSWQAHHTYASRARRSPSPSAPGPPVPPARPAGYCAIRLLRSPLTGQHDTAPFPPLRRPARRWWHRLCLLGA